jgi:hypothetical protein
MKVVYSFNGDFQEAMIIEIAAHFDWGFGVQVRIYLFLCLHVRFNF